MCDSVDVPGTDGVWSLSDMRSLGWVLYPDDSDWVDGTPWGEDSCLCGVDVEAVLDRNVPNRWRRHEWGYEVFV